MAEFMSGLKRTHYCGTLRQEHVGAEVVVCGWVQRQRDLGQLIFVDLRDRTGLLQLAFDNATDRQIFEKAAGVRAEYVLAVRGIVRERSAKNPELPTGDVEIEVQELRVLAKAETPPFEIVEHSNVKEELRLKYRYLDLRRPDMQDKIIQRHKIVTITGFWRSRPRSSSNPRPRAPAITLCRRACSRGISSRCRSRPSSTSSC